MFLSVKYDLTIDVNNQIKRDFLFLYNHIADSNYISLKKKIVEKFSPILYVLFEVHLFDKNRNWSTLVHPRRNTLNSMAYKWIIIHPSYLVTIWSFMGCCISSCEVIEDRVELSEWEYINNTRNICHQITDKSRSIKIQNDREFHALYLLL